MGEFGVRRWRGMRMGSTWMVLFGFASAFGIASAERSVLKMEVPRFNVTHEHGHNFLTRTLDFLWQSGESGYQHVWPDLEFGWQIVLGTFVGFCGAAFGSVGGVGGGGIFVPMLSLIIGFDPKSSTAISKCTSTKAFLKGVETWKKETIMKKEAARRREPNGSGAEVEYKPLPSGPNGGTEKDTKEREVTIIENVYWKEFGLLAFVWVSFLALQIIKENYTTTCSTAYWVLNLLQVPISVGVTAYEATALFSGRRVIASTGDQGKEFTVLQLFIYCVFGVLAGVVGGLLGLGGGFVMGPLFLELGVPPQVSSATATFAMTFSSSMSVIEYYLLKRFPVPYAVYFTLVATIAALVGQHIVRKLIILFGRASLIIFILAFTIFVSAISLGGVGISNMVGKIQSHEYMGFENICKYGS
ncbi:sulfite exporter TauE/SafE family protein 3-like isoform X2 [Abrus precatorius]|uniref:Sulfite exporter TauE/SafE family protein 3-like isoform X2 n=1 Tax=Abrus precatorius TaxID=3816 RepID=A0A8B8LI32_ABRPR|nr:sulfite exporter TauE/SafE family protein 3-like isoform X2 [Abrus precatorius]